MFLAKYFSEKSKNKQATLLTLCFIIVNRISCNASQFLFSALTLPSVIFYALHPLNLRKLEIKTRRPNEFLSKTDIHKMLCSPSD